MPDTAALHELTLLVGRIDGKLDSHMASVERDRNAQAAAALESAEYRKDVRHRFNNLAMQVQAIAPLEKRVETVEGTAIDWKHFRLKLAGAIFALSIVIGAIGTVLTYLAPVIKAAILRLFGFS